MVDMLFCLKSVMILVVGFGKCMCLLIVIMFKLFIEVNGQVLIDYGMDWLVVVGIKICVVNVYYFVDLVEVYVNWWSDMDIVVLDEWVELLEIGGGIKNVLLLFGFDLFVQLNLDICYWIEGVKLNLEYMILVWDEI